VASIQKPLQTRGTEVLENFEWPQTVICLKIFEARCPRKGEAFAAERPYSQGEQRRMVGAYFLNETYYSRSRVFNPSELLLTPISSGAKGRADELHNEPCVRWKRAR